jgi:serine O-acetyltransferase
MSLRRQIYKDYRRYRADRASWFATIFLTQGFWATCVYRVSRHVHEHVRVKLVRKPLIFLCVLMGKFIEIVTGIFFPLEAEIGEGLKIAHFGPTIFASQGSMGRNCSVSHGVTLGLAGQDLERGGPVIGDRVYLGPHAIVIGRITIGDDTLVCPGAVVLRSVPPRAVVMGNPARVVSYKGSFDYIKYDGMESDSDRIASLSQLSPQQPDRDPGAESSLNGTEAGGRGTAMPLEVA